MIIAVKNQTENHSIAHIDSYLSLLCQNNQLKEITKFLSNPEYSDYLRSLDFATYLILASKNNHLSVVKWLLTDDHIKQYTNINTTNGRVLEVAIIEGHNKIVNFLLNSSSLDKKADPYINNDKMFSVACGNGNLDALKLLLQVDKSLPDTIENKEKIQKKLEIGFLVAFQQNRQHVLEYILLDLHLTPTNNFKKYVGANQKVISYLKEYSVEEKNKIFSYFENRDLNEKLHKILPTKKLIVKSKI